MGASGSVLRSDESENSDRMASRNLNFRNEEHQLTNSNNKSKANQTTSSTTANPQYPTFDVSLGFWPGNHLPLPDKFKLKISYESLDFVRSDNELPIIQFPFQTIICWGSSSQNFQFKIFDINKSSEEGRDTGILISLKTTQGRIIEDATMSNVQKLMIDINQRAITKEEFWILLQTIFDENGLLKENWLLILQQFTSTGKLFLAKQGMELLQRVSEQAPFEKFDLACFIYERMINKNSVQLLINTFEDQQERDNLIHRLQLDKDKIHQTVVTNCVLLPEKPLGSV
eukprot:gene9040-9788_t